MYFSNVQLKLEDAVGARKFNGFSIFTDTAFALPFSQLSVHC
jgi:hypothetical protein